MPTLWLLVAQQVAITTTCRATSHDNVWRVRATLCFHWRSKIDFEDKCKSSWTWTDAASIWLHYSVMMSAMASSITGVSIVCPTFCLGADKKNQSSTCAGNPLVIGGFPSQRASNAENVSIWWHHHVICCHCCANLGATGAPGATGMPGSKGPQPEAGHKGKKGKKGKSLDSVE